MAVRFAGMGRRFVASPVKERGRSETRGFRLWWPTASLLTLVQKAGEPVRGTEDAAMRYETRIIDRSVEVTSPRTGAVRVYQVPLSVQPQAYALRCAERVRVGECLAAV